MRVPNGKVNTFVITGKAGLPDSKRKESDSLRLTVKKSLLSATTGSETLKNSELKEFLFALSVTATAPIPLTTNIPTNIIDKSLFILLTPFTLYNTIIYSSNE
jgi:hypothetical protein